MSNIIIFILILIIIYMYPLLNTSIIPSITITTKFTNKTMILHRTWSGNYVNSKMFKNCYQKWNELNKNICQIWYSDRDCKKFMKTQNPIIYNCYNKLKPTAFKADLFRLCILYEYGGIYVDASSTPFVSIKKMIKNCTSTNTFISVLDCKQSGSGIHNGLIISVPKHPFLKAGIDEIVKNVKNEDYTDCILGVTGPKSLEKSLHLFLNTRNKFKIGWNNYGIYSFYLYKFQWGIRQNIYKKNQPIISKKHCLFSYITDKMKSSAYNKLWLKKNIYN